MGQRMHTTYELEVFFAAPLQLEQMILVALVEPFLDLGFPAGPAGDVEVGVVAHGRLEHAAAVLDEEEVHRGALLTSTILGSVVPHQGLAGERLATIEARNGGLADSRLTSQPCRLGPWSYLTKPRSASSSLLATTSFHFSCAAVPSASVSMTTPSAVRSTPATVV